MGGVSMNHKRCRPTMLPTPAKWFLSRWFAIALLGIALLGAARDCRTATVETGGAPIVEADASVDPSFGGVVGRIDKLEAKINTVDSWTSMILAISIGFTLVSIPVGIFVYLLIHRIPVLRYASDRLKGKACRMENT